MDNLNAQRLWLVANLAPSSFVDRNFFTMQELDEVYTCLTSSALPNPFQACLSEANQDFISHSGFENLRSLSAQARSLASQIVMRGESAGAGLFYQTSREQFETRMNEEVWNLHDFQTLTSVEQNLLRSLACFYGQQIQPNRDHYLNLDFQRDDHNLFARTYRNKTISLNSRSRVELLDSLALYFLPIRGMNQRIHIMLPTHVESEWGNIQNNLWFAFQLLQEAIPVSMMNDVLSNNFSIVLGNSSWADLSYGARLQEAHADGLADYNRNEIILDNFTASSHSSHQFASQLTTFLHEFGHFIFQRVLTERDKSNWALFKNQISENYQNGNNRMMSRFLGSEIPVVSRLNRENSPHSLDNENEFFADCFTEYVLRSVFGEAYESSLNLSPEDTRQFRARYLMMSQLIRPDGLHGEALSAENIRRIYRYYSHLDLSSLPSRFQTNMQFGIDILIGLSSSAGMQGLIQQHLDLTLRPDFSLWAVRLGFQSQFHFYSENSEGQLGRFMLTPGAAFHTANGRFGIYMHALGGIGLRFRNINTAATILETSLQTGLGLRLNYYDGSSRGAVFSQRNSNFYLSTQLLYDHGNNELLSTIGFGMNFFLNIF